jgi:hypothetical protein
MPPPKKAAKKVAKKVAKHADPKHHEAKDLRRAYEHLGRIESLQRSVVGGAQTEVATLVALAQQQLKSGDAKNAAELLRAAEHLSFAGLAAERPEQTKLSGTIKTALEDEHRHLTDRAVEHWERGEHPANLAALYASSLQSSQQALRRGAYREAMEFVRAAEALAHVERLGSGKLTAGSAPLKLARS